MLAIRMQRTGRKGHAQFRVVVQDSRQSPTSGKFVAHVGSYDPHTKSATLVKDKIEFYLKHGAQPSDRTALLFKKEGIKLPKWVAIETKKQGKVRNPEKHQKAQPAAPAATESGGEEQPAVEDLPPAEAEAPAEAAVTETTEEKTETKAEVPTEEKAGEKVGDKPVEDA
jgi:small subunit ribosomal protein S16